MKNINPENATMVFKGKIFEVWQWPQKLYDGSTATFEFLKRPNTVSVIATLEDKIMILDQKQPQHDESFISLPGGRQEENEDPLVTAQRELLEETGYVSNDWELWVEYSPFQKIQWTIYYFVARDSKKQQEQKLDGGEQITLRFISLDEFIELSDNKEFDPHEISLELLKAKYEPEKRARLQKLFFGN